MSLTSVGDSLNYNINRETGEVIETRNDSTYKQRMNDLDEQEKAKERKQKEAKNSPYNNFAQMNLDHSKDWRALSKQNHVAAEILWFLIEHADKKNALVCSSKVLEEALGYSRTTIFRSKEFLKNAGFIKIKKSGTTDVFLINKEIAWKSWGKNYKYGEFEAKIIISASEQEDEEDIIVKDKKVNMVETEKKKKKKKDEKFDLTIDGKKITEEEFDKMNCVIL
ncbi:MAG: replication/maintenance protein RepL [Prevotella sp.]|nr:replication/maintenance protein RepL [Prevotella sp.]